MNNYALSESHVLEYSFQFDQKGTMGRTDKSRLLVFTFTYWHCNSVTKPIFLVNKRTRLTSLSIFHCWVVWFSSNEQCSQSDIIHEQHEDFISWFYHFNKLLETKRMRLFFVHASFHDEEDETFTNILLYVNDVNLTSMWLHLFQFNV